MQTIFKGAESEAAMLRWYEHFRARIPAPMEGRTVETRFGRTHMLTGGPADAPPLILLPGMLVTSAHAMSEMAPLLERFRVHALDVVGHSIKSEGMPLSVTDEEYGEWLVEVLDALALDRTHVMGASFGGFVAQRLAALAPERIERLVLLAPAGVVKSHWSGWYRTGIPMMLYLMSPSEKRLQAFVRYLRTTPDEDWERFLGDLFRSVRLDRLRIPRLARPGEFARLQAPTLVIGADLDLSFPGVPLVARARDLFPNVETELLRNCRHMPPTTDEFRQWLAARVTEFLEAGAAQPLRQE